MRHINVCDRGHGVTEDFRVRPQGHRKIFGEVTGSPKTFGCGHWVAEDFWVSLSHRRIDSRGRTPFRKRGKGSGKFRCSHSFTCIALALRPHKYLQKTDEAAACGFKVDLHLCEFQLKL